jgi:BlaI family penicillinase repressor
VKHSTDEPRTLSDAEWEVMKIVWEGGPLPARDVHARVPRDRRWVQATVKTLLRRLVDKGWLTYTRVGNSFLYEPAVSRRKGLRSAIRRFSERVLDGSLAPFVAYYAQEKRLTPEDVAQLEKLVKQYSSKKEK